MRTEQKQLSILQYNTHTSLNKVMAPMLRDPEIQKFDILAIQEPWRNPHKHTTHQWSKSGFQLAYKNSPHTRVCFYVNNRIAKHSWSVQLPTPDLITMIIETKWGPVNVHNVYNSSPR